MRRRLNVTLIVTRPMLLGFNWLIFASLACEVIRQYGFNLYRCNLSHQEQPTLRICLRRAGGSELSWLQWLSRRPLRKNQHWIIELVAVDNYERGEDGHYQLSSNTVSVPTTAAAPAALLTPSKITRDDVVIGWDLKGTSSPHIFLGLGHFRVTRSRQPSRFCKSRHIQVGEMHLSERNLRYFDDVMEEAKKLMLPTHNDDQRKEFQFRHWGLVCQDGAIFAATTADRVPLRPYLLGSFIKFRRARVVFFFLAGITIYVTRFRAASATVSIWILGLFIDYWQATQLFPRRVEGPSRDLPARPVQDLGRLREETWLSAAWNWVWFAIAWGCAMVGSEDRTAMGPTSSLLLSLPLVLMLVRASFDLFGYSTNRREPLRRALAGVGLV